VESLRRADRPDDGGDQADEGERKSRTRTARGTERVTPTVSLLMLGDVGRRCHTEIDGNLKLVPPVDSAAGPRFSTSTGESPDR
jgi:hypothetical protein